MKTMDFFTISNEVEKDFYSRTTVLLFRKELIKFDLSITKLFQY